MSIQTWRPSALLSILFLFHNGSNCGSASLQILNLSGFQCSFRRLFYSAIFFYTFVYEATKRERAGEWEVRRPRFTLGAKFILCGDKIYFFTWPFLLSRPRYSLICLYRCKLLSKLLAGCLCIIVRYILADNTLAAYHCSSGCCHSLYPVTHPLTIAPSV